MIAMYAGGGGEESLVTTNDYRRAAITEVQHATEAEKLVVTAPGYITIVVADYAIEDQWTIASSYSSRHALTDGLAQGGQVRAASQEVRTRTTVGATALDWPFHTIFDDSGAESYSRSELSQQTREVKQSSETGSYGDERQPGGGVRRVASGQYRQSSESQDRLAARQRYWATSWELVGGQWVVSDAHDDRSSADRSSSQSRSVQGAYGPDGGWEEATDDRAQSAWNYAKRDVDVFYPSEQTNVRTYDEHGHTDVPTSGAPSGMRWFRDVVQALPHYSYVNEPPPEDLYPGAEPRLEGKKIVTPGGDGGVLSWLKNPSKSPLPLGSEDLTDAQLAELQQSLISDREAAAPVPNEDLLGYADLDLRRHKNGSTGGYGTGGGPAFTADELATLGTVAEVAAGIVAEPIDWALTVREIYNDPKNPLSYAGLIPFVPTGVGKLAKEALQAADKGGEVGGAVGRFAKGGDAKVVGEVRITGDALAKLRKEFRSIKPQAWREEAARNADRYTADQLARMRNGQAPIGADGFPMEIHHKIPLTEGGLNTVDNFDFLSQTEHRLGPNFRRNHPNLP